MELKKEMAKAVEGLSNPLPLNATVKVIGSFLALQA